MCVPMLLEHCRYTHCNTLQHTATNCRTLPHTATPTTLCNTLQHSATLCNTLQRPVTHHVYNLVAYLPTLSRYTANTYILILSHTSAYRRCWYTVNTHTRTHSHVLTHTLSIARCLSHRINSTVLCDKLQHTATHCTINTATHCNTLQHAATQDLLDSAISSSTSLVNLILFIFICALCAGVMGRYLIGHDMDHLTRRCNCVVMCCTVLQYAAVYRSVCSMLHNIAVS